MGNNSDILRLHLSDTSLKRGVEQSAGGELDRLKEEEARQTWQAQERSEGMLRISG